MWCFVQIEIYRTEGKDKSFFLHDIAYKIIQFCREISNALDRFIKIILYVGSIYFNNSYYIPLAFFYN